MKNSAIEKKFATRMRKKIYQYPLEVKMSKNRINLFNKCHFLTYFLWTEEVLEIELLRSWMCPLQNKLSVAQNPGKVASIDWKKSSGKKPGNEERTERA